MENPESAKSVVFEKISPSPVLFFSSLVALGTYLVTFYLIFIILQFSLLIATFIYLTAFLVIFAVSYLIYRHKANQMNINRGVRILGTDPVLMTRRTGVPYIDILGLIISGIAGVIVTLLKIYFLFPFFMLCFISFLIVLLTPAGTAQKWDVEKGRKTMLFKD
jgi:hypothetical protein